MNSYILKVEDIYYNLFEYIHHYIYFKFVLKTQETKYYALKFIGGFMDFLYSGLSLFGVFLTIGKKKFCF